MLKKISLFLVILVCLFAISTVSASEISNETNMVANDYDSGLMAESVDEDTLGLSVTDDINQTIIEDDASDLVSCDDTLSISLNDDCVLESKDDGTFTALQKKINNAPEGSTINLENDYAYNSGFSTEGITINKELTINGNGHVIDALGQSRIFFINSKEVTLNNILFKNGNGNYGGAIRFSDGDSNYINNCSFVNNKAHKGGAIYGSFSNSEIEGIFVNNTSENDGGAICFIGVSNTSIYGIFISNHAGTDGGSIKSIFSVNNSYIGGLFVNNTAEQEAGAIYFSSVYDSIIWSNFVNNTANNSGGAIYAGSRVFNSSIKGNFMNNEGYYGGGICFTGVYNSSIEGSFVNNTAIEGGAIRFNSGHDSNVTGSFVNNTAKNNGGAILFYNAVYNSSIEGSFVNNTAKNNGGAICFNRAVYNSSIEGSFVNNRAGNESGAIHFDIFSKSSINGTFMHNTAGYSGAAINFHDDVSDSNIIGVFMNNTVNNGGNAINFYGNVSNSFIINSIIMNNIYCKGNLISVNTWFGNDVFNYENKPYSECASWLFFNASSTPIINVGDKSTIIFTLNNLYNSYSKVISHPDISDLPDVVFELSAVNGYLDKYSVRPGESVIFTSTANKDGILKVSCGGVSYYIKIIYFNFDAPDVNKYYNGSERFVVTLSDSAHNPIPNTKVSVNIGGKTTDGVSDSNGQFSIPLDLNPGNYTVTTIANGIKTFSTVNIYSTIESRDINAIYNDVIFKANFLDSTGRVLNNREVQFKVNSKTLNVTTNSNGVAGVNIDLSVGNYVISTNNPVTGEIKTNNIVISKSNSSVSISIETFSHGATLTANINSLGNLSGEVIFIMNGKEYTAKISGSKAIYTLNNLATGKYTVKAVYNGDTNHKSSTSNSVNFIIEDKEYYMDVPDVTKNYGGSENLEITLTRAGSPVANANVNINVLGKDYSKATDSKGKASMPIDFNAGSYEAVVSYGDVSATSHITVKQLSSKTTLSYVNNAYNNVTLTAAVSPSTATGNVVFNVNGKDISSKIASGKATYKLSDLAPGHYTIKSTYKGDANHKSSSSDSISFNIREDKLEVSAPDLIKYYKGSERFVVTVKDKDNKPVVGKNVTINLNGKPYTRTTDSNGQASMAINLNSGVYNVTSQYEDIKVDSKITVKSTVSGNDVTKIFKNGTQYYATFVDTKGNLMKNTDVRFNINGIFYTRTTDDKGVAKMNINLPPKPEGYIITAENPNSTEKYTNVIKVLPSIVENYDLTKYYKNASKYTLRIIGDDGKPVGEGVTVKLNINGVFYERKTNASGYMNMNINLPPGTYTVTAEYNGLRASNQIIVKPILDAKDLTKKYGTSDQFIATLVDGQGTPYANQEITFNINGVFYKRITDSSGQAKLNINLIAGEYIITSMYSNGAAIANKVTISG